jgi:hypothetical protein
VLIALIARYGNARGRAGRRELRVRTEQRVVQAEGLVPTA